MSHPQLVVPGDPSSGYRKIYAFTDGVVQTIVSKDGNFEAWEKEHGIGRESGTSGK